MIACHHTDWKYKRTEIGYGAFASSRGTGVIPTVLRHLVEFLFAEYGFERIEVRTDVNNQSSRRAAEKAGFTLEGELRRNFLNLGEVTDDAIFSVIPDDLSKGDLTR
jgi:RimJ/RimL family protein N-acetyltransferase